MNALKVCKKAYEKTPLFCECTRDFQEPLDLRVDQREIALLGSRCGVEVLKVRFSSGTPAKPDGLLYLLRR